jgi:HTH-type transcriptional regulator, sugar sensing transcriptional regulator
MTNQFEQDLQKIGLSDKEAKVYLAGLELGPATVLQLSKKSAINRTNAYDMIGSLIQRGLMSPVKKGKKQYFISGKPEQILYLLDERKKEIEAFEVVAKKMIEKLKNFKFDLNESDRVSVFEGHDATGIIHNELQHHDGEVFELAPIDIIRKFVPPIHPGDVRTKNLKHIKHKSLKIVSNASAYSTPEGVENRFIDCDSADIEAEINIYGKNVVFTTYKAKPISIHIESNEISRTMMTLLLALWDKASKSNPHGKIAIQ